MGGIVNYAKATDRVTVDVVTEKPPEAWPDYADLCARLLPCTCLVCGGAMRIASIEPYNGGRRVTYDGCGCGNKQFTLLDQPEPDDGPRFPCPRCGKETLEHSVPGTRICAMPPCREVVPASRYEGAP